MNKNALPIPSRVYKKARYFFTLKRTSLSFQEIKENFIQPFLDRSSVIYFCSPVTSSPYLGRKDSSTKPEQEQGHYFNL
jgi:hypothetical protein